MSNDTRSLWEIYDSDIELWRKGRTILILVGLFYFIGQALVFSAAVLSGSLERALIFAGSTVFFWLLFYFIWIGLHWIRWLWGAWNLVFGFCLLIWAWRDSDAWQAVLGSICFFIGIYLCLSPSVYFFALRQRETVRWLEAGLIALVCVVLVVSLGIGMFALGVVHLQREKEARLFADEAVRRVYFDRDLDWTLAHVTPQSLQQQGVERLNYFFADTKERLGEFQKISPAHAVVNVSFQFPSSFNSDAQVTAQAQTAAGPVELHGTLFETGQGWQIDRMWWNFLPLSDNLPSAQ